MRFGLVGQGGWGVQHARAIREEGGDLAWVVGASPSPVPEIAAWNVPYYQGLDFERLPAVDVVDLVVPNHLHAAYAEASLRAGFHVLLEKPMATSVDDAEKLLRTWRRSGRVLAVGYEMRFSPLWRTVRDLIRTRLGDWQWMDLSLERHPFRPGRGAWRQDANRVGDWIIEEAVHHLDLLGWLGGRETSAVQVQTDLPGSPPPFADLLATRLRYAAGGLATYRSSLSGEGHHLVFHAYGPAGSIRAEWHGVTDRTEDARFAVAWRQDGDSHPVPVPAEKAGEVFELRREIRSLMAAVRGEEPLWMDPEAALWNLRLSDAVTRAGVARREIALSPAPRP